ncbi:lipid-A-disaccharide synthase [Aquifex pyrophilus]
MKRVFISLADRSASNYVYEIFREGFEEYEIWGLTDQRLEEIGIKSVGRYEEISAVGITEALTRIPKFLKLYGRILKSVQRADTLILCDAPALNLKLLKDARKLGVNKVIYFISPQVWAWKPKRARIIGKLSDHLIVILPFEKKIYRNFKNLKVHYVGHPLVDMAKPKKEKEDFLRGFRKKPLPILLGSREAEIKRHTKLFKNKLEGLKKEFEPVSPTFPQYESFIKKELGIRTLSYDGASYDCFYYSDASIVASGTASLEAGLALNPHVVYYRVNPLTYLIGKRLVKIPFVSLVNILLRREVVPEAIQKDGKEILKKFEYVYERREKIREELSMLRYILGERGVIARLRELFREII